MNKARIRVAGGGIGGTRDAQTPDWPRLRSENAMIGGTSTVCFSLLELENRRCERRVAEKREIGQSREIGGFCLA